MANRNCQQLLLLSALMTIPAATAFSADHYTVTDLGDLSGPICAAVNISNSGQVVGLSTLSTGNYHAAFWDGAPIDIGTIGVDTQSSAFAVNNSGQVVGVSYNYGDLSPRALMWQNGTLTSLGTFSPHDINDSGVVAGHITVFNASSIWADHPCIWTATGLAELPTLGGYYGQAMAINSGGRVAGQAFLVDNKTVRACLWVNGTSHDLGSLAGTATAKSGATDLNDGGQVVGWSESAGGAPHATLFQVDSNGSVTSRVDLGVLAGNDSHAYGVNNMGEVVGASDARAFLWQGGAMIDLNTTISESSGWVLSKASAINDSGVIVGEGIRYGFGRAVMLTPSDCLKGDMNDDSLIDGADLAPFVRVMLDGGNDREICSGDVGPASDNLVNLSDVDAFVNCLLNGGCG
ncbi:MAG: DUF3466 family protein [Planctomycetes bacterium]|nr:DUF3466 family protein [Planctomycetota bacterium]